MQQHQLVTAERGHRVAALWVRGEQRVRSECPPGWLVAQRSGGRTALAAAKEPEDHPARHCDEPEAGKTVEQHRSQRLAGPQAGGNEGQAERALGHTETTWRDVEALRGDSRTVDK